MSSVCEQCGLELGSDKPADVLSVREEAYSFCGVKCISEFVYPKLTKRICARDGCNSKVPEGNRFLCWQCYHQGNNIKVGVVWFSTEDMANWGEREQGILERIKEKVRVYSSRDMTQEELRELVPSLRDKEE